MLRNIKKILLGVPFLIAAGLFAAYLLFSYFAVDPLAKRVVPWLAENELASRATVEEVRFDPFRLALTVRNLRLTRADGAPLAGFERLHVDLESSGLLRLVWRFKDIHLAAPQGVLDVAPDGTLNWADLIAKLNQDKQKSDTIPRVLIDHILIERGNIQYSERNRPTPFKASLEPLGLELNGLSTLPEDRGEYQLAATLPQQGGTLKWKGSVGLNPIVSDGVVQLQGIKIAELMRIAPVRELPLQIGAGELRTDFSYGFAMVRGPNGPIPEAVVKDIAVNLGGVEGTVTGAVGSRVAMARLNLKLPEMKFSMRQGAQVAWKGMAIEAGDAALQIDNTPLFKLPLAQIRGIDFDLAARRLTVAEVLLANGAVRANRSVDGSLDWQRLINPAAAADANALKQTQAAGAQRENRFGIDVGSVRLAHWQADFQDASFKQPLGLNVQDMNLAFALSNSGGDFALTGIESTLGPFAVKSAQAAQSVATVEKASLQGGAIRLKDNAVKLQSVVLTGLQTKVLREANRPLNWQALLEPARAATPATGGTTGNKASAATDWKLALDRIALENATLRVEDRSTSRPVILDIQNAGLEIRDGSLDPARPLPLKAQFKIKQGGQFNADGKLALEPLKVDLKFGLRGVSLKPFSPYLNQIALLTLERGSASLSGRIALKSGKLMNTQFQGGFSIDDLAVNEENSDAAFIGWKSLASSTMKLELNPNRLHMDELRVVEPVGKVIIYEDKSINIQRIMRAQSPPAVQQRQPNTPEKGGADPIVFPIAIERVRVDSAELEFADLSLTPQFGTHINTLSGVVNGLSNSPNSTAQVELDGKVDEFGSARIRGSIQPFRATDFTDLKLAFHNLEMNRLTPYSGKFAGRKIESGKMSVDLEYNIKQRQLAGENKFVINKLKLGEHVDSPDAFNLPLDLAIALLEDSDGVMDLDLPITGSLDDPQFSYGKIVWKAIVNVLGKIVTAPFRALGKLLGVSAEKMENVAFDAGSAELAPPEMEKLKTVGQALVKRPGLRLTIAPGYDPQADKKAIQESTIRRDVLKEMGVKLDPTEKPGPIDLNNSKAQSVILKLARDRSPEAKNKKFLDKFKDFFDTSKPTDPAAYQAMLQQLQQWVTVPDNELAALAHARAAAMQQALAQTAGLNAARLAMAPVAQVTGNGREVALKMTLGAAK